MMENRRTARVTDNSLNVKSGAQMPC
jgi:hypothetical protein